MKFIFFLFIVLTWIITYVDNFLFNRFKIIDFYIFKNRYLIDKSNYQLIISLWVQLNDRYGRIVWLYLKFCNFYQK